MLRITITICLLLLACFGLSAQSNSLSSLELSYTEDFRTNRSNPAMCMEDIYEDSKGKLWLKTCGSAVQLSAHLFSFDGYSYQLVKGPLSQLGSEVEILGTINDTLYGNNEVEDSTFYFKMDLLSQEFKYYDTLPTTENQSLLTNENKIYNIYEHENILTIHIWDKGQLTVREFDVEELFGIDSIIVQKIYHYENNLWIWDCNTYQFGLLDISSGAKSVVDLSSYLDEIDIIECNKPRTNFHFTEGMLHLTIGRRDQSHLFSFQLIFNQGIVLRKSQDLISSQNILVFEDKNSQVLYLSEDNNGLKATLQLKGNIILDASKLFNNHDLGSINKIVADNFLKEFYILEDDGFSLNKVKIYDAIHPIPMPSGLRSVNEWPEDKLLINTQNRFHYLYDLKTDKFERYYTDKCNIATQILKQKGNEYWSFHKYGASILNPLEDRCETIPTGFSGPRNFVFYKENIVIVVNSDVDFFQYNIQTKKGERIVLEEPSTKLKSIVQNIFVDSRDRIWIVNSEGLYNLNIENKQLTLVTSDVEGFNFKLLSIEEDSKGNLWLGSSLSGLIIFNPETKDFRQISSEEGLCNNTIATITRDNQDMFWLGTYKGVALLNENGELLTNFYENDGLANNESNRYSAKLLSDGKIAIGSIRGLSILNPDVIRRNVFEKKSNRIYLTNIEFLDEEGNRSLDHSSTLGNNLEIELQPESRNLNLEFSISNYLRPNENKYSYLIEEFHDAWVELGNKNKLDLRDLPAGNYNLRIRGGDYLGNWSDNVIDIRIKARQFFYENIWFYLLLAGMISAIILFWISSLRKRVKRATEEIIEDKKIIERQAEKLKELDQAKSDFFTNISHEFRTPLTIISGMIDQIRSKPDTWLDKGSQMIKENTVNLLNLVNQILDLRKLESNSLNVQMVQGDIVSYVQYLVQSHKYLAEQKQIKISFQSDVDQLIMDYDPEKFLRILTNLLSNAIKYNKVGGSVNVNLKLENQEETKYLRINVQDTGQGITEKDIKGIFNRFYQGELDEPTAVPGTGIGLSLTKQLTEFLGGEISVKSILGSGSVFSITLPITNNSEIKEVSSRKVTDHSERTPVTTVFEKPESNQPITTLPKNDKLPNLLIVEDNESIISLIISQLEDDYNISFQLDGEQGVTAALNDVPDIIISDVMMPKKDGNQLCKELKSDEKTSHIPIILLTAKADQESKILGLESKADAYFSKPFDAKELKLKMSNLLELRKSLQKRFKILDSEPEKTESPKEDAFVLKIRTAILDNIDDESFGVIQLCRAAGLSRSQLHNKTKALTGLSTANYIRTVRLQKAREMLLNSDLNVSEVAYAVGFNNTTYFSTSYLNEFGENPSKTRK